MRDDERRWVTIEGPASVALRLDAETAREHIGDGVAYLPAHGPREDGTITSVGSGPGAYVFVRFAGDNHSKAVRPHDLILLSAQRKES